MHRERDRCGFIGISIDIFIYRCTISIIAGATFKALNDFRLGPDELFPYLVTAVIKTQASCPVQRVQNKICLFLSSSDIATLEKGKKPDALEAEEMLRSFRSIAQAEGVKAADQTKFLGQLDTVTVRHLLNKPMELNFKKLQDIAVHFMKELGKLVGKDLSAHSACSNTASSSKAVPNLVQFDATGKAVGAKRLTLQNKGFVVDTPVADQDGQIGVVKKIDIDGSVIVCRSSSDDAADGVTVHFDEFLAKYTKTKSEIEHMQGWRQNTPMSTESYQEAITKSRIQIGLAILGQKFEPPNLRIQIKPCKSLFVEAKFACGKVVLVPETTRINAGPKGSEAPVGGYLCKIKDTTQKAYCLVPLFSKTFAVPIWCIKTTGDETEANMEVQYKKVSVSNIASKSTSSDSTEFQLPVLVNTVALEEGQELIVYRPASSGKAKAVKRHLAFSDEGASKQAKA